MRAVSGRCVILSFLAVVAVGCATLPKNIARSPSSAMLDTGGTALGRLISPAAAAHPAESGFLLYNTGEGAIQARVALAETAESSIDAQYYEWAGDELGRVLLERVLAAADRGVRVRLLIDDYTTRTQDVSLSALEAHPNIEVRVFNPFVRGRSRLSQYLGRFTALNHRMHNKMWIVDGQVAVIGGRNLTNDYFGMGRTLDFRDFDLLAIGDVVPRAAGAFDRYWNSQWAYPISTLRKPATAADLAHARARFGSRVAADRARFPYALPRDAADALAWLERFRGQVTWAEAEVVYDDPSVVANRLRGEATTVAQRLSALVAAARREIVAENAYLIPSTDQAMIRDLEARGVEVRLLTNSLATTDVVAINAAYSKTRPALVQHGVALYEMKPRAQSRLLYVARPDLSRTRLALHGKAAVFDREVVFLGSFNLDPRSRYIDTEAVFVVHSAVLAAQLLDAFAVDFQPQNAWHIGRVAGKNKVTWITDGAQSAEVEPHDPAGLWRRVRRSFSRLLPLAGYL
jgi:cardiolipin synthase C